MLVALYQSVQNRLSDCTVLSGSEVIQLDTQLLSFAETFVMLNVICELAQHVVQIKSSAVFHNRCFHTTSRLSNLKTFKIYRWNPETPDKKPEMKSYTINTAECGNMVLDALIKIKSEQDPTLAFRRSCREGICGTCGMNIGGVNTLACLTPIRSLGQGTTSIYPLPHMYVMRDLITDMSHFYKQHAQIQPWLQRTPQEENVGKQSYEQSERDQEKLVGLYECILCNCCSQSCPAYWWHYDKFYGPAVLLNAYRWIIDSRDNNHNERLEKLRGKFPVFACHTIMNCTKACPKKLNPGYAVNELKRLLAGFAKKEAPDMENPPPESCTNDK